MVNARDDMRTIMLRFNRTYAGWRNGSLMSNASLMN